MDEASNGVDPVSRKNLYSYLKNLTQTSTLLITHRIDEAEKICDKIAIMANGIFLDIDRPTTLKEKYGIVYVLQVEPTGGNSLALENVDRRIVSSLRFCKRIYSESESDEGKVRVHQRTVLTYRFDEVEASQ